MARFTLPVTHRLCIHDAYHAPAIKSHHSFRKGRHSSEFFCAIRFLDGVVRKSSVLRTIAVWTIQEDVLVVIDHTADAAHVLAISHVTLEINLTGCPLTACCSVLDATSVLDAVKLWPNSFQAKHGSQLSMQPMQPVGLRLRLLTESVEHASSRLLWAFLAFPILFSLAHLPKGEELPRAVRPFDAFTPAGTAGRGFSTLDVLHGQRRSSCCRSPFAAWIYEYIPRPGAWRFPP